MTKVIGPLVSETKMFEIVSNMIILYTQVNRMSRSRRVLAIGGKHCEYGWTGSVFIHFYFL